MRLTSINKKDIPVVVARNGLKPEFVNLDALKETGQGLVTYGLQDGDTFEFPEREEDLQIIARPVRENGPKEMLILGLKNGNPAWLSVANLRRWDADMKAVHPVAEALRNCENDAVRIQMCLGRTIVADGEVTYQMRVFENGVRTDETRPNTVAKLCWEE